MASTATRPKGKTFGILVLIIAAVAIASAYLDRGARIPADDDVTEQVVLSVMFKQTPRLDNPVHVSAMVEGVQVLDELMTHSPGVWTITVPKGAQVSMNVQQDHDGEMNCQIAVKDKVVSHNVRDTAGSIRCWYNRRIK